MQRKKGKRETAREGDRDRDRQAETAKHMREVMKAVR